MTYKVKCTKCGGELDLETLERYICPSCKTQVPSPVVVEFTAFKAVEKIKADRDAAAKQKAVEIEEEEGQGGLVY